MNDQAAAFTGDGVMAMPSWYCAPWNTSLQRFGALSFRKRCSATRSNRQMIAVAFSTFLKRFAAEVRSRTAANGDSTTLVVRRCRQCSFGNV